MKLSRGWQITAIFSIAAILILVTALRVRSISQSAKEIRAGFNEARTTLDNPEIIDTGKAVTDLIRDLREATGQAETNRKASLTTTFDPANLVHIVENQPINFVAGESSVAEKKLLLENISLTGDWNEDGKTDFAGIISALEAGATTWYLTMILDGDQPLPLPAIKLSEDYPIITGLAEGKNNSVTVIETLWKEQKSRVRTFKLTGDGIKEE